MVPPASPMITNQPQPQRRRQPHLRPQAQPPHHHHHPLPTTILPSRLHLVQHLRKTMILIQRQTTILRLHHQPIQPRLHTPPQSPNPQLRAPFKPTLQPKLAPPRTLTFPSNQPLPPASTPAFIPNHSLFPALLPFQPFLSFPLLWYFNLFPPITPTARAVTLTQSARLRLPMELWLPPALIRHSTFSGDGL